MSGQKKGSIEEAQEKRRERFIEVAINKYGRSIDKQKVQWNKRKQWMDRRKDPLK